VLDSRPVLVLPGAAHDPAARLRASGFRGAARRAERSASGVRFGVDDPEAMNRLHVVTRDLRRAVGVEPLLASALVGALELSGAELGNIQIRDPATGALRIVAQHGFGPEFLEHFAVVEDDGSACGRAAGTHLQTVIVDVDTDEGFAPHRRIAAASGFRAVVSTPVVDDTGRLVGMISVHHRRPQHPSDRDLRLLERFADTVGQAVNRLR
jgi:GAF domain-containing protein